MFFQPPFLHFLEFQIDHYTQRVQNARSIEERIFLKKDLHNLKQALITHYN